MSTERFKDRIAYITGAGSGIGQATAKQFAADGAKVFAVDVNGAGVSETISAIRAAGGVADGGVCDVTSIASVQASVAAAVGAFGGLNILVNAAGVGGFQRFEDLDAAQWHRVISVNLTGPFNTTKLALAHLLQRKGNNIVNVASTAGMRGQAYAAHYAASKAGLVNFTRSIALEFASRGLRANCVCPGGVMSPLLQHFVPREDFEPQLMAYCTPPVQHLMSQPEDVAREIAFLASDEAHMISGTALVADGGTLA